MSLDPQAQASLDQVAATGALPVTEMSPAEARGAMAGTAHFAGDPEPVGEITDRSTGPLEDCYAATRPVADDDVVARRCDRQIPGFATRPGLVDAAHGRGQGAAALVGANPAREAMRSWADERHSAGRQQQGEKNV